MANGITYEDVVISINNILSINEGITIDKIRTNLGNTGSRSTISKYYRKWKDEERLAIISGVSLKTEIPSAVSLAVNSVIEQRYEKVKKEYSARLSSAEADAKSLEKNLSETEEQINLQFETIKTLENQLAAEKIQSDKLSEYILYEKEHAEKMRSRAEFARIEAAELHLKIEGFDEIKSEVLTLRKELKEAIAATAMADKEAATENARIEGKNEQISMLKQTIESLKK